MPEPVDVHIRNIQSKLQLLLKKHALLSKENDQLKKELLVCQTSRKELLGKNEQLVQQVSILKASAGLLEGKEKTDFEKSINRYIRSIDRCITLLNK